MCVCQGGLDRGSGGIRICLPQLMASPPRLVWALMDEDRSKSIDQIRGARHSERGSAKQGDHHPIERPMLADPVINFATKQNIHALACECVVWCPVPGRLHGNRCHHGFLFAFAFFAS